MMRRVFPAIAVVCALAGSGLLQAQTYTFKVVASGLNKPTGIAIDDDTIYFTEIPTPGVAGGMNAVKKLDLEDGMIKTLHFGEPQPVNIVVGRDGSIYWVCLTAGVILKQDEDGVTSKFLTGLNRPSGIAMGRNGTIYFTEIPTPGVPGGMNGVFSSKDGQNIQTIHTGEPEPVDIAVAPNGDLYWTCRTAGVILERSAKTGMVRMLLKGLNKPTGIAVDKKGRNLYFTEVPTPGVSGANGGTNRVSKYNLSKDQLTLIHMGDPQPTDITVASDGTVYWTCTSAGVIVEAKLARKGGGDDHEREND